MLFGFLIDLTVLILSCNMLGAEQPAVEDPEILLNRIRSKMIAHLSQLPNYTCHEVIDRFGRPLNSGRLDRLDTVELEVAFVGSRELFARSATASFEDQSITKIVSTGTISSGAFGAHIVGVFSGDAATFKYIGPSNKEGHKTFRYDFVVPQDKSHFLVRHNSAEGIVGYKGSFWVDADTLDLVRLELKADHIPDYIGVSMVRDVMLYKPLRIRDSDFLLPYKSELAAIETSGFYYTNILNLERCKEFTGESVVKFGAPVDTHSADRADPDQ